MAFVVGIDPDSVPIEEIAPTLIALASLQTRLAARLIAANGSADPAPAAEDSLLPAKEAAARLACSVDWLYRHAGKLPFAVRLGPGQLRFSSNGIDRFIRQRQGK